MVERMYFFGDPASGKTKAALDIAHELPDHKFFYIEADRPTDKIRQSFGGLPNVEIIKAFQHDDIQKAIDYVSIMLQTASDPSKVWVVVDTISKLYDDCQDTVARIVHGMTADELAERRLKNPENNSVGGNTSGEWAIITRKYMNDIVYPITTFYGNNFILISHQKPYNVVRGQKVFHPTMPVDKTVSTRLQDLGWVPTAHHQTQSKVDTFLHFNITDDKWTIYTVKDTERNYLNRPTPFTHFWHDYNLFTSMSANGAVHA
jgi:hypothetical protein